MDTAGVGGEDTKHLEDQASIQGRADITVVIMDAEEGVRFFEPNLKRGAVLEDEFPEATSEVLNGAIEF